MIRYTVTYTRNSLDALARLWLAAPDRLAITTAGAEIDRELRVDAALRGFNIGRGYRQLIVSPLVVDFSVEEGNRIVTVWSVRHIGELTNGH
jgi:hypothetical protein